MTSIPQDYPIKELFIETSFGKMHTIISGEGPDVVFLHGWNVSAYSTQKLMNTLAPRFRVHAPTMPGSRPSFSWKKKPTPQDVQEVLKEWFEQLPCSEEVILMGHSLGGVYSLLLTKALRERGIKKLILIDIVGLPFDRPMKEWAKEWLAKRTNTYKTYNKADVVKLIDSQFFSSAFFRTRDTYNLSKFARTVDISDVAKDLTLPVTILWGSEDTFTPVSTGEAFARTLKNCQLHVVPGNHDWPLLAPEHVKPFL